MYWEEFTNRRWSPLPYWDKIETLINIGAGDWIKILQQNTRKVYFFLN